GDFRGATISFKTALRRQPTWEGLSNGLGWSRLRLGRYQLAASAFQSALNRNSDYVDALNGLGSAQFERGNYEAALPPLEKALQGSRRLLSAEPPEVTTLRGKMAWSLYYLERHREALAMYIRASLAAPDSHQYQVGMGWCYLKLGRNDLLVRELHSHYCNMCDGDWEHAGHCLDSLAACCPWCFPKPGSEPMPGARSGPHFHVCSECGQNWHHATGCSAPLRAAFAE